MSPGLGQQPRFIVTVQPPGVHFDTPAVVTFPNTEGLPPGFIAELYSFDHDLGQFVAIGTGAVSEDGTVLQADTGVGLVKGGWQFPYTPTPPAAPPTGSTADLTVDGLVYLPPQDVTSSSINHKVSQALGRPRSNATPAVTGPGVAVVGACGKIIATGYPAAGTISFQPADSNDPDVVEWTSLAGCPNASTCTATFKAKKPGTVTLKILDSGDTAQATKDIELRVVALDLTLSQLTFVGTTDIYHDPDLAKIDPVWKFLNTNDQNGPVMISKGEQFTIQAKFTVNTPPPVKLDNVGFKLTVDGFGKLTPSASNGHVKIAAGVTTLDVEFKGKFDDAKFAAFYWDPVLRPMTFKVSMQPPSSCALSIDGDTAIVPVYTTFTRVAFKVYLSTLHIAVAGNSPDIDEPAHNATDAFARVWAKFATTPAPHGATGYNPGTRTFKYYSDGFDNSKADEEGILANPTGSGRCGGFMPIMGHALALAGVASQGVVVDPPKGLSSNPQVRAVFLVKNWSATASTFSSAPPFVYQLVTYDDFSRGGNDMLPALNTNHYGDLDSGTGIPGENTPTPAEKIHYNHAILLVNGRYYDSSYGVEYKDGEELRSSALDYYAVPYAPGTATLSNKTQVPISVWKARLSDSPPPTFTNIPSAVYAPQTPAPPAGVTP